jgi:hypothetical protein
LTFLGPPTLAGRPFVKSGSCRRSVAHAVRTHLILTSLRIDLVHDLRQVVGGWRRERRICDVSLQLFQRQFLADGRSPANPSRNSQMFLGRTGWAELAPGSPNLASRFHYPLPRALSAKPARRAPACAHLYTLVGFSSALIVLASKYGFTNIRTYRRRIPEPDRSSSRMQLHRPLPTCLRRLPPILV